jgi:hypothetical protein
VDFVTGSTRFGSLSSNTHVFTGSLAITGGLAVSAGSVGVGTITPKSYLHLSGDNSFNTPLADVLLTRYYTNDSLVAGSSLFHFYNNTDSKEYLAVGVAGSGGTGGKPNQLSQIKMVVGASGNVGIGTSSPIYPIDVYTNISSSANIQAQFYNNDYSSGVRNFIRVRNGISIGSTYSSYFGQGQNGKTYIIANDLSRNDLVIDGNNGYVGIGTATPGAPLEISYNNTSFTTTPILSLNNTNINGQTHINFLITGSLVGKIRSDYEGGMIYVTNNLGLDRSHYFLVNGDVGTGSVAMAISASGRIGMGTSSPAARLDIQGGSDGDGMISIGSNSVSGILNSPANIYINADSNNDSASGVIALGFNRTGYTGGTEAVRILEDGSVGIGITNPSRRLQVKSNSEGQTAGISGATYGIRFDNGGTNSPNMSTIHGVDASLVGSYQPIMLNGSDVRFGTSDTERVRITSGGYLRLAGAGIQFNGDTSDANSLDDYEEGTWTPSVVGASGESTYPSLRLGWYTKVGRLVTITWFVSITKNNMTGTLRMTGFPFTLLGGSAFYPQGTVLLDSLSTATNNITMQGATNSNSGDFIGGNGSTSTHTGLPIGVLGAGSMECRGTLTYFT